MNGPRIGSLCSGYGGLDMAVQNVFGGEIAWFFENDKAPSKILAHHWPEVPNYGDMTKADWAGIEQVDILCGGTPCQDLSGAGKRAGMTEGTRSNLWVQMREAIAIQRPSIVIWENVRGAYSACADSEMGRCPRCMGLGGEHRPFLRALGRVLGDLSSLGYDSQWVGVRASDIGAPHSRFRVFVVAYAVGVGRGEGGAESAGRLRRPSAEFRSTSSTDAPRERLDGRERPADEAEGYGRSWHKDRAVETADSESNPRRKSHGDDAAVADSGSDGRGGNTQLDGEPVGPELEPPQRIDADRRIAPNPGGIGGDQGFSHTGFSQEISDGPSLADERGERPSGIEWGDYRPAIQRWEQVLGRTAPSPTRGDGRNDGHRLNAEFVEWMMGVNAGHVTSPAIGLTRNEQLKALGNGVVTLQAEYAIRQLVAA